MNKYVKYGCLCLSIPPLFLFGVLLLISSYFYFTSGTFTNPSTCWEKAFYSEVPENVEIVNAEYWNSAHWTHEYIYYFKIKFNEELLEHFTQYLISDFHEKYKPKIYHDAPKWFPKPTMEEYEIWVSSKKSSEFALFHDKDKQYIFIKDSQL